MQEMQVWSLVWEDPLEKEMATHSRILAWKTLWSEQSGGLQSIESAMTEPLSMCNLLLNFTNNSVNLVNIYSTCKCIIEWISDSNKHLLSSYQPQQTEKGVAEDEMVRQPHWLNEHECDQTPGESGQRSLVCCSPRGLKELDMPERLNTTQAQHQETKVTENLYSFNGEGNGNPGQYSCLENPMDGGAW